MSPLAGYDTIMHMIKHNQNGGINVLLLPLILASTLLIVAASFGFWAFGERQNYKNNSDQIVAKAVEAGKSEEAASKDKEYAEIMKNPLKTYNGPEQYGSVMLQYPKTWSSYVNSSGSTGNGLDTYFNTDVVPSVEDENSIFSLRLEVVNQSYSDVLAALGNQEGISSAAYALPKVPKTIGIKVDGQIAENKQGSMVILPLRDKTLKIYTESTQFLPDFNSIILPNMTFAP